MRLSESCLLLQHLLVESTTLAELPLGLALPVLFVVALLSATVLPLGSEAALWALAQAHPDHATVLGVTATAGNSLGALITYAMGRGAARWVDRDPRKALVQSPGRIERMARVGLQRWGAPLCLLSWLPVVGDALVFAAGWWHLPAARCAGYIVLGKGARYAALLAWVG